MKRNKNNGQEVRRWVGSSAPIQKSNDREEAMRSEGDGNNKEEKVVGDDEEGEGDDGGDDELGGWRWGGVRRE